MTNSAVLGAKVVVSILLSLLALWLVQRRWIHEGRWRTFASLSILAAATLRIAGFCAIYGVMNWSAASDVSFYTRISRPLLWGENPWSGLKPNEGLLYGPLFPHVTAVPLFIYDSPNAIVAFMIVIELCALACWLQVGKALCGETAARKAAVVYVCFPLTVLTAVLGGNNDLLVSLFIAGAALALIRRRDGLSPVLLALGVAMSKLLVILAAPVLMLAARSRVKWAATFLVPVVVFYGSLMLWREGLLGALRQHSGLDYSSGNIPFLLDGLNSHALGDNRPAANAIAAFGVAAALGTPWWFGHGRLPAAAIPSMLGLLTMVVMLLSAKAFPHYLLIALFPIFLVWCQREWRLADRLVLAALGVTTGVESSLWFRWIGDQRLPEAFADPAVNRIDLAVFVAVDVLLVGCYLWLLIICARQLRDALKPAADVDAARA